MDGISGSIGNSARSMTSANETKKTIRALVNAVVLIHSNGEDS